MTAVKITGIANISQRWLPWSCAVEKYDVVNGGSAVTAIHFGYSANQAGFGWTNAVFLELLSGLTKEDREKLLAPSKP